jgi:hypothetical protein
VIVLNFEEHVHIIPLGFEIDRAVIPFEKFPANRVYLLVTPEDPNYEVENAEQKHCLNEVKKKLQMKKIEVIIRELDLFDIKQLMNNVSSLVLEEKSKGNIVYVNMSAGGRLASVGATFAAMAHNAKVYYVGATRYSRSDEERQHHGISICDKPEGMMLENFQIKLPDEPGKIVLTSICRKGKPMNTDEILTLLISKKIEIFQDEKMIGSREERRRIQQKNRVNLNKIILDKLDKNGYITREKSGRFNKINLTESGKYMANLVGMMD